MAAERRARTASRYDLQPLGRPFLYPAAFGPDRRSDDRHRRARLQGRIARARDLFAGQSRGEVDRRPRSEEHTSELQSLMRISYAVFCLKNKNTSKNLI